MAKYENVYFLQLTRIIFDEPYKSSLSVGAKWLFVVLNELEHRFTSGEEGSRKIFYRTDVDLAADCGWDVKTLKKYKAELRKTKLIKVDKRHFNEGNDKKSEKRVTVYQVMR